MTARTFCQQRAIAMHAAQRRKVLAERRKARLDAIRDRLVRQFVMEGGGWVFAVLAAGAAIGIVLGVWLS